MQSANLERMFSRAYTKYSDTFLKITAQVSPGREQGIKNFFEASVTASSETWIRTRFFFKPAERNFFARKVNHSARHLCEWCRPCLLK